MVQQVTVKPCATQCGRDRARAKHPIHFTMIALFEILVGGRIFIPMLQQLSNRIKEGEHHQ